MSSEPITKSPQPTAAPERLIALDALRGVALLGILLINSVAFALPGGPPGLGYAGPVIDRLALAGVIMLVESKFFSLFSFLFGVGFAVQFQSANQRGDRFLPRFGRRLLCLAAFGLAHIALLWEGDILLIYAVVGSILLAFRRVSNRGLIIWVIVLLGVPLLLYLVGFLFTVVGRFTPELGEQIRQADAELIALFNPAPSKEPPRVPSYGETIPQRLTAYSEVAVLLASRIPTILAMFLMGLLAGRAEVFRCTQEHRVVLRRFRRWGLGFGMAISAIITAIYFFAPAVTALVALFFNQALAGPILGLGYAATLTLAFRAESPWVRPLSTVGRMALTNYLLQSVALAVLFWPQGFGLAGRLRPVEVIGVAVTIYVGQVVFSTAWLSCFEYGPMEWLWRAFTYLRWPRMLKSPRVIARNVVTET